ncbi:MAG: SPFH domain-containing protein, partial [Planctomycetaceae bacterium]|nr:SPFH domain-containing protein [Planctomycetaceae bacterium]
EIADVFDEGHYELKADNLPLLSTLQGWKYGFNSPFRSEVYFVSTRQITDLKWGTPNPVMLRDPEFGPIRLRAFGTYVLRAVDPKALLKELVGANSEFHSDELSELMRSIITQAFTDMLGTAKIAALDLATHYQEMSVELRKLVSERIDDEYGLEVPQLFIVNISLPEAVEKALDVRTSMGVVGDMNKYQQYQMGNAMMASAENPGGGGAEGMGLGMGFAMANRMAQMGAAPVAQPVSTPPPVPNAVTWHAAIGGQSSGPYTLAQIQTAIQAGQLDRSTLVWCAGMGNWQPAGEVAQTAGLFGAAPPPLP